MRPSKVPNILNNLNKVTSIKRINSDSLIAAGLPRGEKHRLRSAVSGESREEFHAGYDAAQEAPYGARPQLPENISF